METKKSLARSRCSVPAMVGAAPLGSVGNSPMPNVSALPSASTPSPNHERPAARNPLATLFIVYAATLVLVGMVLLVAPALAAQLWPWTLPPILGQVYSVFFLTFALGGRLAAREPGWEGVWIYVAANLIMLVLIVAVSLIHADRFKAGPETWSWYGFCLAGVLVFVGALVWRPRQLATSGAIS